MLFRGIFLLVAAVANGAVFQYEALGVSADWIVVRENIPASSADTSACTYPRLDPAEHVGVRVHFIRLSSEAKRARLAPLGKAPDAAVLYTPSRTGRCTAAGEAARRWDAIAARAKGLGISLPANVPDPVVLGNAVPAKNCSAIGAGDGCRALFEHSLPAGKILIGVALSSVPQAPEDRACQFVGYRLTAAIQVSGLDFATTESGIAPGGFASHYDCRSSQFDPLRLSVFGKYGVIVASFRGTNIADREEHPFVTVFPTQPAP